MFTVSLQINGVIRAYFASIKEAMLLTELLGEEFYGQHLVLNDSKTDEAYVYNYNMPGWVKR